MAEETKEKATSKESSKKKAAAKRKTGAKQSTVKRTSKRKAVAGARANGKKPNMTAFILQFPETVKPQEIVEKAKAQNLTLEAAYASTVRSKAKSAGTWPSSGAKASKITPAGASSTADTDFYRALKRVGVTRAKELIANIEAFQNA